MKWVLGLLAAITIPSGIYFTATGGVKRLISSKLQDAVSVCDFESTCPSATSDEAAVNLAVAKAGALGLVDFPCPGTYVTTTFGTLSCGRQYLSSGASAKARTLAAKLGDQVSVRDFGAVGDGVADEVTAFTAVAAYANAHPSSTIYFPDGTYKYSGGLVFTQPVTLTGGHGAVLNYTGSGLAVKLGPDGLTIGTYEPRPYRVIGLTFTGGATMTQGIYFNTFIVNTEVASTNFSDFGSPTGYAIFFQAQNWDSRVHDIHWWCTGGGAIRNGIRVNGVDVSSVSDQGQTQLAITNALMNNQSVAAGQTVGIYLNGAFGSVSNSNIVGFAPNIWVAPNGGASGSAIKIRNVPMEVLRGSIPCIMYGEASGPYATFFTEDLLVEDSYCNVHNTDFATTVHFIGPASATSGLQDAKINNNLVLSVTAGQPLVVLNNSLSQAGNQATGNRQGTGYPDNPPKPLHTAGANIATWGGTDGDAFTFWNGADAQNTVIIKSGASAAQTSMLQLQDFNGNNIGSFSGTTVSNRATVAGPGGVSSAQFYSDGRFGLLKGIDNDSTGYKHIRSVTGCATGAAIGATCDTTVTWGTTSADAFYTPICVGFGITSGIPLNGGIVSKANASAVFRTVAMTAAAAQYTNIYCQFTHD